MIGNTAGLRLTLTSHGGSDVPHLVSVHLVPRNDRIPGGGKSEKKHSFQSNKHQAQLGIKNLIHAIYLIQKGNASMVVTAGSPTIVINVRDHIRAVSTRNRYYIPPNLKLCP